MHVADQLFQEDQLEFCEFLELVGRVASFKIKAAGPLKLKIENVLEELLLVSEIENKRGSSLNLIIDLSKKSSNVADYSKIEEKSEISELFSYP